MDSKQTQRLKRMERDANMLTSDDIYNELRELTQRLDRHDFPPDKGCGNALEPAPKPAPAVEQTMTIIRTEYDSLMRRLADAESTNTPETARRTSVTRAEVQQIVLKLGGTNLGIQEKSFEAIEQLCQFCGIVIEGK